MRYAGRIVVVAGHVEFRPVLGAYEVDVTSSPAGLVATALQGRLPGLFLSDTSRVAVVVDGIDGAPFLRLAHGRVTVDTASPNAVADRQARGLPVLGDSGWTARGTGWSTSWLDPRLSPPGQPPAEPASASVVRQWAMPVVVHGRRTAVRGVVRWVPTAAAGAGPLADARGGSGSSAVAVVVVVALGGLVAAAVVRAWLRRRRRNDPAEPRGPARPDVDLSEGPEPDPVRR
jgi:hypothetical protein